MAAGRAIDEADVRSRIDRLAQAIRAMDVEAVVSIYASDVVSFDIEQPLRYAGSKPKEKHWVDMFAMYRAPLKYEMSDVAVVAGDGVAFSHSLNRVSGTLKDGRRSDFWLRWTACFRKLDGNWLIAHDHVSVPADLERGRGLLDLEP